MKILKSGAIRSCSLAALLAVACSLPSYAAIEGSLDPESVVESWSEVTAAPKIIDINFSDTYWPNSWAGETGRDCPDYSQGGYVNAVINVDAGAGVSYPVLFHNCTFATKASYNGFAGATAAFCRQYYIGENAAGNTTWGYNNWTAKGHTQYLEDNITTVKKGNKEVPTYGEAGFVQMCRDAAATVNGIKTSMHGWMEIDHVPYIHTLQWSWSSTSWGRGIKCDIRIADGEWKPLVWMGSERQKQGWTVFSDQGYFMENVIDAHDVSLRWRVWDGEDMQNPVQVDADGKTPFTQAIDPYAQRQAPRVHKIKIYGAPLTGADAKYAAEHPGNDVGELSDLTQYGYEGGGDSPDTPELSDMLAFPTAQGFGKYTSGGRGGKVVKVTSTADDGSAGTLRWAFQQHKGEPITIVFEVGGEIALSQELRVSRNDWTLAGQTAPGAGILISRNKVNLGGSSNFIVRNVRFRIGRTDLSGNILAENALGAENCSDFIFDHCSFGWSVEENMNTADSHFLTVQYCMVHEGLYNAGHSKGARGYGCQWGGSPATYHHNLLAHNHSRSCRFNGARGEDNVVFIEYANNVNYNYGSRGGCYGGENTAAVNDYNGLNSAHECNFMGNYYLPGPGSDRNTVVFVNASYARDGATSWAPSKWYVNGNVARGFDLVNADNWKGMAAEHYTLAQIRSEQLIVPSLAYYKYTPIATVGNYDPKRYMLGAVDDAETAFNDVTAHAGTVNRDAVERRVASDAIAATATYGGATLGLTSGFLDTEADAEGFYAYPTAISDKVDTDADGMPDEWEKSVGLNPTVADNNVLNVDGYTALEVYLASLMGEEMDRGFDSGVQAVVADCSLQYEARTRTLTVSPVAVGGTLAVYATNGMLLYTHRIDATAIVLPQMTGQTLIVRVAARGVAPRSLKVK